MLQGQGVEKQQDQPPGVQEPGLGTPWCGFCVDFENLQVLCCPCLAQPWRRPPTPAPRPPAHVVLLFQASAPGPLPLGAL